MRKLRIALAQVNVTVGDLEGNLSRILTNIDAAKAQGTDIVVFPELAIPGAYVEEDRGDDEIEALGADHKAVNREIRMLDRAQYSRRHSPATKVQIRSGRRTALSFPVDPPVSPSPASLVATDTSARRLPLQH